MNEQRNTENCQLWKLINARSFEQASSIIPVCPDCGVVMVRTPFGWECTVSKGEHTVVPVVEPLQPKDVATCTQCRGHCHQGFSLDAIKDPKHAGQNVNKYHKHLIPHAEKKSVTVTNGE